MSPGFPYELRLTLPAKACIKSLGSLFQSKLTFRTLMSPYYILGLLGTKFQFMGFLGSDTISGLFGS